MIIGEVIPSVQKAWTKISAMIIGEVIPSVYNSPTLNGE